MFLWLKPGWPISARFLAICSRVTPSEIHSQTTLRRAGGRWATLPRGSRLVAGLRKSAHFGVWISDFGFGGMVADTWAGSDAGSEPAAASWQVRACWLEWLS